MLFRGQPRFLEFIITWTGCGIETPMEDLGQNQFRSEYAICTYSSFADIHASSMRARSAVKSVETCSIHCVGRPSDSAVSDRRRRRGYASVMIAWPYCWSRWPSTLPEST